MKKFTKILCLVLCFAMMASLAACGSKGPEKDENQTDFYIMGGMSALSAGYDSNPVLNKMAEDAGITIEWDTMSDSLAEQVNIRIAGEQLPDAFQGVGFNNYDLATYGADGVFIDLTPYINEEVMPNLTKILEENPDIRAAITHEDGGIYGLPSGGKMGTGATGSEIDLDIGTIPQFTMINKAWLDELDLPIPTTTEELRTTLEAFIENDMSATYYGNAPGTTIGISCGYDQWCWGQDIFYAAFGFTTWSDVCRDLNLRTDGTVEFLSATEAYREAITYYHDWVEAGLFDTEMFSQSSSQLISKCSNGYVGVGVWWEINELMGDYAKDYVYLPPLEGPNGECNVTLKSGKTLGCGDLSVTSACGNPAALLKFYDMWYDGEIVMQLNYAPIGVYYTGQDENGQWISITDEEAKANYGKSSGELKAVHEVYGPKLILSEYYAEVFHMEDRAMERLNDLVNYWYTYCDSLDLYPGNANFTNEELETIDRYKVDFERFVAEQEALWLKEGGPSDEEWQAYLDTLVDTCGMDILLEIYQGAYDRYVSNAN